MRWPKTVIMCPPENFTVAYAINPHMKDEFGNLNKINTQLAASQWTTLKELFTELGISVHCLKPKSGLPDQVFTANPAFPYLTASGEKCFVKSKMATPQRHEEAELLSLHLKELGYRETRLNTEENFEGMGDAIWNYDTEEVFCGYGFRTSRSVPEQLSKTIKRKVHALELIDERFYHLDTCFVILNKNTAAYCPDAFSHESASLLSQCFSNLIQVSVEEAEHGFACNALSLDGQNIVLQSGSKKFEAELLSHGFKLHPVETSEYMKSGGSVYCMKLQIW